MVMVYNRLDKKRFRMLKKFQQFPIYDIPSLVPRLSNYSGPLLLFHTASAGKLGVTWERGYMYPAT